MQKTKKNESVLYMIVTFAYILLGLTLVGAFLNLIVLQRIVQVKQKNPSRFCCKKCTCDMVCRSSTEKWSNDEMNHKLIVDVINSSTSCNFNSLKSLECDRSDEETVSALL